MDEGLSKSGRLYASLVQSLPNFLKCSSIFVRLKGALGEAMGGLSRIMWWIFHTRNNIIL